jgi:hypothetical protein
VAYFTSAPASVDPETDDSPQRTYSVYDAGRFGLPQKQSELKLPGQWWPEARTKGGSLMLLRDHPLMSRLGVPSWPPLWTWVDGEENKFPKGEVGILIWASLTGIQSPDRCYLLMNHDGSSYMGCLLFDDDKFCRYVAHFLERYCNRSIAEIGSLDLSHTL